MSTHHVDQASLRGTATMRQHMQARVSPENKRSLQCRMTEVRISAGTFPRASGCLHTHLFVLLHQPDHALGNQCHSSRGWRVPPSASLPPMVNHCPGSSMRTHPIFCGKGGCSNFGIRIAPSANHIWVQCGSIQNHRPHPTRASTTSTPYYAVRSTLLVSP